MTITIEYSINKAGGEHACCAARTEVRGETYFGCGQNWDRARANLIENVKRAVNLTVPLSETINLAEDDGEMPDTEELLSRHARRQAEEMLKEGH